VSPKSKVCSPKNLAELDSILSQPYEKVKYIAGATDIMVQDSPCFEADILIDLSGIPEISQKIEINEKGLKIGAAVPMSDIIAHPVVKKKFPMLIETCRQIGSVQIQNRATIGGNIANASPAGDTLPVLRVYGEEIIVGPLKEGRYEHYNLEQLMSGPGQIALKNNQYIAFIFLPFPDEKNQFWYFRKVGMRQAMAISKISLAVLAWKEKEVVTDIRICAGSVSPKILRASHTEQMIRGKILDKSLIKKAGLNILAEIEPIDDVRSTINYRRYTCQALLTQALTNLSKVS